MDYFDKIKERLSSKLKDQTLTKESSFKDLGIDSLDLVDLVFELEEELGVEFQDDELLKITTVQDLLDLIGEKTLFFHRRKIMIYQVDHHKVQVNIQDIQENHRYIGMMSLDELKSCYQQLGIEQTSIERLEDPSLFHQNMIIPAYHYYLSLIHI